MANIEPGPRESEREFPNRAASVGEARRFVLGELDGVAGLDADSIALMVSELASNSVRHTDSAFVITVRRDVREVRVAVRDRGAGTPVVREPAPSDGSGRGLRIVEAFADRWGVVPTTDGDAGKTVWFSVAAESEAAGAEAGAARSS